MTEASPGVYMGTHDGAQAHPTSVGVPHFFTDVALLRADRPEPAAGPTGRAGRSAGRTCSPATGTVRRRRRRRFVDDGLVPHRRRAPRRRRRLGARRRPGQGHVHLRRRERLPRRGGGRRGPELDAVAKLRRGRRAGRPVGRGRRAPTCSCATGPTSRATSCAPTWKPTSPVTRCPRYLRVRGRAAAQRHRQDPPGGAAAPGGGRASDRTGRVAAGRNVMTTVAALPSSLQIERHGEVAVLRLARAAKRNALNDATVLGLEAFFTAPPEGVRAVVLDAEGDHFSAGLDLSELTERDAFAGARALPDVAPGVRPHRARHRSRSSPSSRARWSAAGWSWRRPPTCGWPSPARSTPCPEGQHGLFVGGGGSVRVPRLIGAHRMADMMLTGRVLDAQEGHALGLSHYLTGPGEGSRRALELAAEDRGQLPGHELRRAAGAAADRRGQPDRGLPAGVADGRASPAAAPRRRTGCRRSSTAAPARCSGHDDRRRAARSCSAPVAGDVRTAPRSAAS